MNKPRWLKLGEALFDDTLRAAMARSESRHFTSMNHSSAAHGAVVHLVDCLRSSVRDNQDGHHSVAVCLVRQCVEALTLIDAAFQPPAVSAELVQRWLDQKAKSGELRKKLEKAAWPNYGKGMWDEPWATFFSNLCWAVQPYAHYSYELQGWQFSVVKQPDFDFEKAPDGNAAPGDIQFIAAMGQYDPLKASRITLLHILVLWALGRVILQNQSHDRELEERRDSVVELGQELSKSKLLFKTKNWADELAPFVFFKKGHSYQDAE